jgi:transposase-like protein
MTQSKMYKRYRFPAEIIQYPVWLYHRFNRSYRDVEDLMSSGASVSAMKQYVFGAISSALNSRED